MDDVGNIVPEVAIKKPSFKMAAKLPWNSSVAATSIGEVNKARSFNGHAPPAPLMVSFKNLLAVARQLLYASVALKSALVCFCSVEERVTGGDFEER
jgi:hypothetical protein